MNVLHTAVQITIRASHDGSRVMLYDDKHCSKLGNAIDSVVWFGSIVDHKPAVVRKVPTAPLLAHVTVYVPPSYPLDEVEKTVNDQVARYLRSICVKVEKDATAGFGEPWVNFEANSYIFTNDHTIVTADVHNAEVRAHIVACVNACKDINPKSVPDMLTTLRFYADRENWRGVDTGIGAMPSKMEHDSGDMANETLAKATTR